MESKCTHIGKTRFRSVAKQAERKAATNRAHNMGNVQIRCKNKGAGWFNTYIKSQVMERRGASYQRVEKGCMPHAKSGNRLTVGKSSDK